MNIRIFYDGVNYRYRSWKKAVILFEKVIGSKKKKPGDLNFIITGDAELKSINVEFLKHNYYTDVITFDNSSGNIINGEIYISIDTVRRNAVEYQTSLNKEMLRVMIHGVLHLCGFNDSTDEERKEMRSLEDMWIGKIEE